MNVQPSVQPPDPVSPFPSDPSEYKGPPLNYINNYIAVPVKTLNQEIPWSALLWSVMSSVIEFVLRDVLPMISLPEPVRPAVPLIVLILGIVHRYSKNKSVSAASLQDPRINVTPIDPFTSKEIVK